MVQICAKAAYFTVYYVYRFSIQKVIYNSPYVSRIGVFTKLTEKFDMPLDHYTKNEAYSATNNATTNILLSTQIKC